MNYDTIIIGGGLGGLTAGAMLAKEGKKVLLLEQFSRVGGYATAWYRDGVTIEGVLHEIDDMGEHSQKAELLKELGIYDELEFVKIPQVYKVLSDEVNFVLPSGKKNIKKALQERFPDEIRGIEKYFSVMEGISSEIEQFSKRGIALLLKLLLFPLFFRHIIKYEKVTVQSFFDECFRREDIKMVLGANLGYYGDDPEKVPMLIFGVANGSYYKGGGWYVKGGSQRLSDALANTIKKSGGEARTNAAVTKILTKEGRACGVAYKDKEGEKEAHCDVVLNNASPIWALDALDDKSVIKDADKWTKSELSPSSFGIYAVVKGKSAPQGRAYTTFAFGECKSLADYNKYAYCEIEKRGFSITDYGVIDSGLSKEDRRLVSIFITSKYDEWEGLDKEAYEAKKEHFAKILLDRASAVYPDIKSDLVSYETATPLTNEHYTKNPRGAIYGYAQTPEQSGRFRKKYAKILPNLINASAWGEIGGGYSGAIYGGMMAARDALKLLK